MAFIEIEDLYGTIEVIVFPQVLREYNHILNEDNIVYIKGRLSVKEDEEAKLIARDIRDINDKTNFKLNNNNQYNKINKTISNGLYIRINNINNKELIDSIEEILVRYKGQDNVYICTEQPKKKFKWTKGMININSELVSRLETLLGKENIKVKN